MTLLITGAEITFWICAVLAVAGAVGVVASPKPVYSALCLALVMVALAAIYASLEAEFLFAVQIIVYTGAVLMLFLFVIMLFGVQTLDDLTETLKGHRIAVAVAALGFLALLVLATGNAITTEPLGLGNATSGGYMEALSQLIFQRYVIAFEATAGLLITAAVAAMVLAHPKRLRPKPDQAAQLRARLRAYADRGQHPGPLPNSGVTARHNSVATPALLPDGSIAAQSVSPVIARRVAIAGVAELTGPIDQVRASLTGAPVDLIAPADEDSPDSPTEWESPLEEDSPIEAISPLEEESPIEAESLADDAAEAGSAPEPADATAEEGEPQ